jgi:hypothetical protein
MNGRGMEEFFAFIERIDAGLPAGSTPACQNIAEAIRPVFFTTDYEEHAYASHGGTLFLVEFEGRLYGLTCQHVFGDFSRDRLFVVQDKFGKKGTPPAKIAAFYNPSAPEREAAGTDIVDLCVIEFADEVTPAFFGGAAYVFKDGSWATAANGHPLLVAGVLKEKTSILNPDIEIGYCRLQYQDVGPYKADPFLREAVAEFKNPNFKEIVGISGSPVFDMAQEKLCGMVLRGGMQDRRSSIFYMDIGDIVRALGAIRAGAVKALYNKAIEAR